MSERVIGIPGYINASDTSAILTAVEVFRVEIHPLRLDSKLQSTNSLI